MTNTLASIITAIHLAALSQIESGDNDRAIGRNGEVSRYQIMPAVWRAELAGLPLSSQNPRCETVARAVALSVWERRVTAFRRREGRNPTNTELYLLWHRPARALHPKPRERECAERFAALVEDMQPMKK